ncbi:Alpha/Beta hydrolase protein [Exophiala viscosa]|uniref:Alpha/Beta hydrolase protein n=1 Tax=Exophiala viscosa TaxID=2486360 RepID=UPI002194B448|nr:Alpha/Beta hydrolase protein [Exophiala viscosa]
MASATTTPGQLITKIPYGSDNFLQTYDVYVDDRPSHPTEEYWIVYIHGGFFRDALVDSTSFHPAVSLLTAAEKTSVRGYASINYRLSPSTKKPQDRSETPSFELRGAVWPEHFDDVCAGIRHLQSTYSFGSNYVLAGHSVGATLALLAAVDTDHGIVPPKAVLGLSGIYDFPLLHKSHPEYEALTFNAMPRGDEVAASPVAYEAQAYKAAGVCRVLLAHSHDDGLVPWNQVDAMTEKLAPAGEGYVRVLELFGKHNDIWADGKEVSRAVLATLAFLD